MGQRNNEEKVLGIVDTEWRMHSEKAEQSSTGTRKSFKGSLWPLGLKFSSATPQFPQSEVRSMPNYTRCFHFVMTFISR